MAQPTTNNEEVIIDSAAPLGVDEIKRRMNDLKQAAEGRLQYYIERPGVPPKGYQPLRYLTAAEAKQYSELKLGLYLLEHTKTEQHELRHLNRLTQQ